MDKDWEVVEVELDVGMLYEAYELGCYFNYFNVLMGLLFNILVFDLFNGDFYF